MFTPCDEKEISEIVQLQLVSVIKMLADNDVTLEIKTSEKAFLTKEGYDPEYGARPVKRAIQKYLLNPLSKELIAQNLDKSKPIIIEASKDELKFKN